MRWAPANVEPPKKPGRFYCWHERKGKCVMDWDGGWGPTKDAQVTWWLQDDGTHQATDGSFA